MNDSTIVCRFNRADYPSGRVHFRCIGDAPRSLAAVGIKHARAGDTASGDVAGVESMLSCRDGRLGLRWIVDATWTAERAREAIKAARYLVVLGDPGPEVQHG